MSYQRPSLTEITNQLDPARLTAARAAGDLAIGLRLISDPAAGGLSRLGGQPNLPPGTPWPHLTCENEDENLSFAGSLPFVAQINLAELPDFPDRQLLPASGMLSFFLYVGWLPPEEYGSDSWRVIYSPGNPADWPELSTPSDSLYPVEHESEYGEDPDRWTEGQAIYPATPLRFEPCLSFANAVSHGQHTQHYELMRSAKAAEFGDPYGGPCHQLMGQLEPLQASTGMAFTKLLLTLAECEDSPGFKFWHNGRAHFYIFEHDLHNQRFDKAIAEIESF